MNTHHWRCKYLSQQLVENGFYCVVCLNRVVQQEYKLRFRATVSPFLVSFEVVYIQFDCCIIIRD